MKKCGTLIALSLTAAALTSCTVPGTMPKDSAASASETASLPSPTLDGDTPAPDTASESAPLDLESVVQRVQAQYPGEIGIAISDGTQETTGGSTEAVPAWSTSKVPLAIVALRNDPQQASAVSAAITQSDNASAEQLWASLGDPASAAQAVAQVLSEGGVNATVQSQVVRPGFSSFGQTLLSPAEEARFAARLSCLAGAESVLGHMKNVAGDQSYGLGTLPDAAFKGGWGPTPDGGYEARQLGTVQADGGRVAIALWVRPEAGDYGTAQQALTALASELKPLLAQATPIANGCA
ncbi:hypothetical protein L1O03_06105 [Corynebacterium uropygiale]|uniref:Secreted protein n=1 Tax=Corynebacterium uropygiale TaxID=1775911 RepID=A0A9X1QQV4_9CORY|nr:hypothetical protein [Corynebacterium uropygiale]MCF4006752.1 hypothetical protein [Corynebacterium uropygiale]